jgi:hypothetical protein
MLLFFGLAGKNNEKNWFFLLETFSEKDRILKMYFGKIQKRCHPVSTFSECTP